MRLEVIHTPAGRRLRVSPPRTPGAARVRARVVAALARAARSKGGAS